ncbi:MAG: DEAD/DEAH box helicase [Planctomycetaceae bacterium]|nr:DEAD/DEAH box helicase [Planctomycetaceae bacterium]
MDVHSQYDFTLQPEIFITGWNRSMHRGRDIETKTLALPKSGGIRVITVPMVRNAVETKSYRFALPSNEVPPKAEQTSENPAILQFPGPAPGEPQTTTRFRIPPDAIKIKDRLQYILQPPLETIFSQEMFDLPGDPFPYQREGIAFLYGAHFAILADEMGLGKTMQAILTIRLLLRIGELKNVLIVCPKPLVSNWKREFEHWAREIPVQIIEGNAEQRKWHWQREDRKTPVRIANYELLHRDKEYYDSPQIRGGVTFDLVVLDESQRIKNQSGATAKAARTIPRRRSWALTGTPVENSSEDLVGIFEFLARGLLKSGLKPSEIRPIVKDHILRRTKDEVQEDLPPKRMLDSFIELTSQQKETYVRVETATKNELHEMDREGVLSVKNVFERILRLKQICNFDPISGESAKLERIGADLDEIAQSGHKAIIFSQWVETLEKLKSHLAPFGPLEYHGKIPSARRDGVIKQFREDKNAHVILMSYGAGSVGLNLQFAGYVFLFDRWWNPAVEDQAINRAHRIGTTGPVIVSRFVSVDTIEEKIDQILRRKRDLSDEILSGVRGGLNQSGGMSLDEIFGLFNLKPRHIKKAA